MKISAIVAGTTRIKRPASRLNMKLVKEGVIGVIPWLGSRKRKSYKSQATDLAAISYSESYSDTLHNIDNCHPWKDEKSIKLDVSNC
jgi:hypothetical protein